MYESDQKVDKVRIEVEIELESGQQLLGFLFIRQLQRITDLLNDDRDFLPFQSSAGEIVQIRKAKIVTVLHIGEGDETDWVRDPFEILGLSHCASDKELKAAYHHLCKLYHPDRLHGKELPDDLMQLAKSRMIRIADAYKRVNKTRDSRVNAVWNARTGAEAGGFH